MKRFVKAPLKEYVFTINAALSPDEKASNPVIKNMSGEKTVFIVSQRASSIMYADKIIVLDDGEAVGLGTHEQLMESCEVYGEIYRSQMTEEVTE